MFLSGNSTESTDIPSSNWRGTAAGNIDVPIPEILRQKLVLAVSILLLLRINCPAYQ
jgi:hypothetical protein